MGSYTRMTSIDMKLEAEEYETIGRKNEKSFTRNRKMNFKDLANSIIFKKGKTLTLELAEFTEKMGKEKITKQAYSKQRMNLNPELFVVLNNEYVEDIYREIEAKRYKGYLVLSIDGTTIEMPNCRELKEYYGLSEGQKGSVGRVRARALGVYDSLNEVLIKATVDPYKTSEKEQARQVLDEVIRILKNEKILIVFDRYYFGIAFIKLLEEKGLKYLMRMKNSDYKEEKSQMASNDEEIKLKVRTNTIFYANEEDKIRLKESRTLDARIIKTTLSSGNEEHLITNLSKEEMNEKEIKELYFTRWNIEKAFDVLKNKINIENFSAKTKIGVEQDFYAQILVYNMVMDMKRDAGERIEKNPKKKYEYKVNMNILVGIFRKRFIDIVIMRDKKKRSKAYMEMIDEINENLVPIKPNRKYPRRRMHSMNKYRSNLRRNV